MVLRIFAAEKCQNKPCGKDIYCPVGQNQPSPAVRLQLNFLNNFKLFLPVQSRAQKYFSSSPGQITSKTQPIPRPQEGRFAIVTDVGCGMRWTRQRATTNAREADGEVVWS
jgi:hypothetical protein